MALGHLVAVRDRHAEDDPEQVRAIIAALDRTIAKLDQWLKDKGSLPSTPAAPAS